MNINATTWINLISSDGWEHQAIDNVDTFEKSTEIEDVVIGGTPRRISYSKYKVVNCENFHGNIIKITREFSDKDMVVEIHNE